ncbi:hypothetical protein [Alicyclobacillus sp. SO9]|uniref:hypothetical protein n=1 Tax=Alicyclobacillus sp. SO9 TaxID=2665646 RepID=UPI001937C8BF|nr:hypothetical protein [Alicyclobacillus sp. SO9]QQE78687.1 hypothetical protein GI364_23000 [Alicyclobacillus sp. SO9]
MRVKLFLPVVAVVLTLTACSSHKTLYFSGKTRHWQIKYQANITSQTSESDDTEIRYIGSGHPPKHIQFKIGGSSGSMSLHNGVLILSGSGCSGCSVTRKADKISAKIQWDGKSELTTLKNEPRFKKPIPL